MPTIPHIEKHFTATETVRDIVIGVADCASGPGAERNTLTNLVVEPTMATCNAIVSYLFY
jgi:hypothetical protein